MKIHQTILAAIIGIGSGIIAIMLLEPESSQPAMRIFCDDVWKIVQSVTELSDSHQQATQN